MAVAEARHRRAARGVDIRAPVGIKQMHSLAANGHRQAGVDLAMQDFGHDVLGGPA
jgi:hypothetical protein